MLFLMSDQQRADSLGMVQAGVEVTPALNRLAAEGVVFTRAYSACPLCVPARTAIATGFSPHVTGVVLNQGFAAPERFRVLHQFLAEAGYHLGHVGIDEVRTQPTLQKRVRFATWYSDADYQEYVRRKGLLLPELSSYRRQCGEYAADGSIEFRQYASTRTGVFPYAREDFRDWQFADAACAFLEGLSERPFALFVDFFAPHPPLLVPEPYAHLFPAERIDLPANVGRRAVPEPPALRRGVPAQLAEGVSEGDWRAAWAAHLGLVRLVDDCVGRILKVLEECGLAEDTVVLFTSDHGDHLGAHCLYQKMEMYEEAIRTPLVIRAPGGGAASLGVLPPASGEPPALPAEALGGATIPQRGARRGRHDGLVSHLDLLPTVLELAGLAVPDGLPGKSLCGALSGGTGPQREAVFSTYDGNFVVGDARRCVIGPRFKYVSYVGGGEELYDLERDPGELVNLAAQPAFAEEKARLGALGRQWAEATGDERSGFL
jgi:arylsulfatase A-like enzyme